MPVLDLISLKKSYGEKHALNNISFGLEKGDFLSIIGPSGSGKTTLLRLIDGLEKPDSGQIIYNGSSILSMPSKCRRSIGMIFQNPALFNAKVFDNVAYSLKFRGQSEDNIEKKSNEILRLLSLYDLRNRNALTLSGGEAQRVALARALVYEPDLLLLDEPTANLDPYNVAIIEKVLKTLNEEKNTTIMLVTHNVFQAKRLAKKAALILSGELVEFDNAKSFFENPKDQRTLTFIKGEMIF